jgi:hypothetical protein
MESLKKTENTKQYQSHENRETDGATTTGIKDKLNQFGFLQYGINLTSCTVGCTLKIYLKNVSFVLRVPYSILLCKNSEPVKRLRTTDLIH